MSDRCCRAFCQRLNFPNGDTTITTQASSSQPLHVTSWATINAVATVCFGYFQFVTVRIGSPLVLPIDIATNLANRFSSCNLTSVTVARKRALDPRSLVMTTGQTRSLVVTVANAALPRIGAKLHRK